MIVKIGIRNELFKFFGLKILISVRNGNYKSFFKTFFFERKFLK